MAATMTSVMDFTAKVAEYFHECKKMGISLLPPDINEGYGHFSVAEGASGIRFGLSAIKNVGRSSVEAIVRERNTNGKYKSLTDFLKRLEASDLNKRGMESLIRGGAFDSLGGKRSQYTAAYAGLMNGMSQSRKRTLEGQMNLFDLSGDTEHNTVDDLPDIGEVATDVRLSGEKEVLGVYISGHPLQDYEDVLKQYTAYTSMDFRAESLQENALAGKPRLKDGASVTYGGMVMEKAVKYTKANNRAMAFLTVEDSYGPVEVIVFSNLYEKYGGRLQNEQVIVIQGKVSLREDEDAKIIANDILFYDDMQRTQENVYDAQRTLWLRISQDSEVKPNVIMDILEKYRGDTRVMIYNERLKQKLAVKDNFRVSPCGQLMGELEGILGGGSVKIVEK
jgi:DNA polymerase-3 subunit alpha